MQLFVRNSFSFLKLFIVFFTPLLIIYDNFWDNQELIRKIIEKITLPGFVLLDDAINLLVFVYFLFYLVSIVKSIHLAECGRKSGVIVSIQESYKIFGSYLWVKILSLFKILCWSLLIVVPGLIVGVYHNFSGMALLIDGKKGAEALMQSRNIIKSNIKSYLTGYCSLLSASIIAAALITFVLGDVITLFELNGRTILAWITVLFEICLYGYVISLFLTFYYYFYVAFCGKSDSSITAG